MAGKVIGLIMAFGAGVLIASVAYELVDDAAQVGTFGATAGGLAAGSVTFFVGDVLIARAGGKGRKSSGGSAGSSAGSTAEASGAALALGALLDGIPGSLQSESRSFRAAPPALRSSRPLRFRTCPRDSPPPPG